MFTYNSLKAALQNFLGDPSVTFTGNVDTVMRLGEEACIKDLNLTIFDQVDETRAFTASQPLVDKPTGCLTTRALWVTIAGVRNYLLRRTLDYVRDFGANTGSVGTPTYYADRSGTQWEVALPAPGGGLSGGCLYVKRPQSLVDVGGSGTTWLSDNVGDVLFYASLLSASEWMKNDEAVARWGTEYKLKLAAAKFEFRHLVHPESQG